MATGRLPYDFVATSSVFVPRFEELCGEGNIVNVYCSLSIPIMERSSCVGSYAFSEVRNTLSLILIDRMQHVYA
jgi:hypothetical protein